MRARDIIEKSKLHYITSGDGDLPRLTFTIPQAAQILGCGISALQTMRKNGTGPKWIRLTGKRIAYRLEDLQAWLAEKAHV